MLKTFSKLFSKKQLVQEEQKVSKNEKALLFCFEREREGLKKREQQVSLKREASKKKNGWTNKQTNACNAWQMAESAINKQIIFQPFTFTLPSFIRFKPLWKK